jgi:hypothetical protein
MVRPLLIFDFEIYWVIVRMCPDTEHGYTVNDNGFVKSDGVLRGVPELVQSDRQLEQEKRKP